MLSDLEIEEKLQEVELPAYTANTITDAVKLAREVRRVHRNGYAIADGELTEGLRGIAVPVRDASGNARAAITASVIEATSSKNEIRERIVPAWQAAVIRLAKFA